MPIPPGLAATVVRPVTIGGRRRPPSVVRFVLAGEGEALRAGLQLVSARRTTGPFYQPSCLAPVVQVTLYRGVIGPATAAAAPVLTARGIGVTYAKFILGGQGG